MAVQPDTETWDPGNPDMNLPEPSGPPDVYTVAQCQTPEPGTKGMGDISPQGWPPKLRLRGSLSPHRSGSPTSRGQHLPESGFWGNAE